MPYDPQRSHRRPRLADDAPAPIDALLGEGSDGDTESAEPTPSPEPVATTEPGRASEAVVTAAPPRTPEPGSRSATPTTSSVVPDVEPSAPAAGRVRPLVLVATVLLLVLLALAWLRRRR